VQHLDSILYLANTSVAAVRALGFRLSVFRFLMSPPFHHLPPLRVIQFAVIAGKWSCNIYLDIHCGRHGA